MFPSSPEEISQTLVSGGEVPRHACSCLQSFRQHDPPKACHREGQLLKTQGAESVPSRMEPGLLKWGVDRRLDIRKSEEACRVKVASWVVRTKGHCVEQQKDNLWPLPPQTRRFQNAWGSAPLFQKMSSSCIYAESCLFDKKKKQSRGESGFFFLLKESVSSSWSSEKHQSTCCDP